MEKKRKELYEVHQELMQVSLGTKKAELVIQDSTLVNVLTGEFISHTDIAISHGRVAYIGNANHTIGPTTEILHAGGKYAVPGFIDGHMHVESTMLSVTEFSNAALLKGTTSVMMDPHEIANVFGAEGVKLMHEEGQRLPLKVFTTYPSCVPATDELEDAGSSIDVEDIMEGLKLQNMIGLGEMMNYPGVISRNPKMLGEIEATMRAGKTVTGHFPEGTERMLQAYIASGVTSCHETVTREQGLEKLRLGMYLMIREGSAWCDVKEVIKVVTEDGVKTDRILLVTDDVYPRTLMEKGHINHVVRRAIEEGVHPMEAIQMATINAARYFNLDSDIGSIAIGKRADIILMDNLEEMEPVEVIADGNVIVKNHTLVTSSPAFTYPDYVLSSVVLPRPLLADDFKLPSKASGSLAKVHVIKVIENSARTEKMEAVLRVKDGLIQSDLSQDILKLACMDRHRGTGKMTIGFAHGFSIKEGAVASTVAHDSHNLLVMGTNEEDMAFAANTLAEIGGGMIVVRNQQIIGLVKLPIAGLMSDQPLDVVVKEAASLEAALKEIGCPINAPFMTFSLIALSVIPSIRISNKGIIDVDAFTLMETEIAAEPVT
ncbi:adenine deaminase [Pradoshia sp.]